MHGSYGPTTRGDSPETAAGEFRGLLAASGSLQGPAGGDPGIIDQLRALDQWAEARGELSGGEWLTTASVGGAEHLIQHAAGSERLIKITFPGQFGLRMRTKASSGIILETLADSLSLRPATPLEYLDRLALHNELFGKSVEFLGLVRWKGAWSMVISQIFLRGTKPSISQIAAYMAEHGFSKVNGENAYFRLRDRIAVFDAHARNFVLTEGVPVPFDVLPQKVSPRMAALLRMV